MVDYFNRWNQAVIDAVPSDRLLVFSSRQGWAPLCGFLSVPVPHKPYHTCMHGRGCAGLRAACVCRMTLPHASGMYANICSTCAKICSINAHCVSCSATHAW